MNGTAFVQSTKLPHAMPVNPSSLHPTSGPTATHAPAAATFSSPSPTAADRGLPVPDFPWSRSITYLLADYEQRLIDHAMRNADGVKRQAATLLGISRYALERRIRRLRTLRDKAAAGRPEQE